MKRVPLIVAALFLGFSACVRPQVRTVADGPAPDIAQLWQEPANPAGLDLRHGPGGRALAPDGHGSFTFLREDRSGFSPGFDVRDANGLEWSVKIGPEAQSEVAVSRLLWAIGFHQPPVYFLPSWTLTGEHAGPQPASRFRPDLPAWEVADDWSWYENPFVGTRPFGGLVAANILVNNWDWKTSNNKIYEIERDGGPPRRVYVVRDLGASLGKTSFPAWLNWPPMRRLSQGSRSDLDDFESQPFIKGVSGDRVEFHYRGIHGSLVDVVTVDDVVWVCRLMDRLSERQMRDAFLAAGYAEDDARRYAAKLRSKVEEGLRLTGDTPPRAAR